MLNRFIFFDKTKSGTRYVRVIPHAFKNLKVILFFTIHMRQAANVGASAPRNACPNPSIRML